MTKASAKSQHPNYAHHHQLSPLSIDLTCTANSIAAIRAAIDNGADRIHLQVQPEIAPERMHGNHSDAITKGIEYAHSRRRHAVLDLDTPRFAHHWADMRQLIERAANAGIDGLILSDLSVMLYCLTNYPGLPMQYAVPTERLGCDLLNDLRKRFGITRILLPRTITLMQVEQISRGTLSEIEVVVFGQACSLIQGRKKAGHQSAQPIRKSMTLSQQSSVFDQSTPDADRCAASEVASNDSSYVISTRFGSASLEFLPRLATLGVRAVHIDPQQHDTTWQGRAIRVWREAVDVCRHDVEHYQVRPSWLAQLDKFSRTYTPL